MIENKLKEFIKKYYLNILQTGIFKVVSSLLITTLLFTITEYFGRFNNITRFVFYVLFIIINSAFVITFIIKPLLQISNILKKLNYEKAAAIISSKFKDMNDEIINYLELKNLKINSDLKIAAINQKNQKYTKTDFTKAIDQKNKNIFIKITSSTLIIFTLFLFIEPNMIKESSERIINYKKDYSIQLFDIEINSKQLLTPATKEHTIDIFLTGKEIPNNIEIEINDRKIQTQKITKKHYQYTFRNLKESINFKIINNDFKLIVYTKAVIKNFIYEITPPKHTQIKPYKIQNQPNFTIEEGSLYKLNFERDKKNNIYINNEKINQNNNVLLKNDTVLNITCFNKFDTLNLKHNIKSKKDLRPEIKIHHKKDNNIINDTVKISDDYGFSKLEIIIINNNDTIIKKIPIDKNTKNQYITNQINTKNNNIKYYYKIYDNDIINKYKSSTSITYNYQRNDIDKIINQQKLKESETENEIKNSIKETENINKEISKQNKNQINNKSGNKQEEIRKQLQKQIEIEKQIELLEKELNTTKKDSLNTNIEKLLKEIEKLNKELSKEELKKSEEDIIKNNKIQEEKLKRILELLKNKKAIDQLNNIKEELKKEIQNINNSNLSDSTKKNQIKNNLKIAEKEINKNLKQINKENNKINDLNNASKELDKKNKQEANKNIQKAIDRIDKAIKKSEKQNNEINYQKLKQNLFNIINLSLIQESYIKQKINISNQIEFNKNLTKTTDSILELTKSSPYLSNLIIDIIYNNQLEQEKLITFYESGNISQINKSQQTITKNLNDIAILLNNALNQTKKQMEGTPTKPSDKKNIEKQLQEQLKQLQDKKGKKLTSGEKLTLIKGGDKINKELKQLEDKELKNKLLKIQIDIKKDIINNTIQDNTINKSKKQIVNFIDYQNSKNTQDKNNNRKADKNTNTSIIEIQTKIKKNDYKQKYIKQLNSINLKQSYKQQNDIYINNKLENE